MTYDRPAIPPHTVADIRAALPAPELPPPTGNVRTAGKLEVRCTFRGVTLRVIPTPRAADAIMALRECPPEGFPRNT